MSAIRSECNAVEGDLGRALHRLGFRYRRYVQKLPGRQDLVFVRQRVAAFVDGDYWHARLLREQGLAALKRYFKPSQLAYWIPKFLRRAERDAEVNQELRSLGWKVIRLWESDVEKNVDRAAKRVATLLTRYKV
ncbi:MAG: very short patch repair endonuclease [Betaproteobacteria bacterium]|nr:very short patch repair endonuclease [Betaproteobacteria bacterium]